MATVPKSRLDPKVHQQLASPRAPSAPPPPLGCHPPEPVFPQHPELLRAVGPELPPETRHWNNDRRVLKFVWQQARRGFKGGARSFDD